MNWSVWGILVCVSLQVPMLALAFDPDPLQDFCVADNTTGVLINGFPCKPAANVSVNDFVYDGLRSPGNTDNANLAAVTPASVIQFPGLNTLGISAARLDLAKGGVNQPHTHPRATEILLLVEGEVYAGFVTTNNTLFATCLHPGQLFVFPKGLVHFELNVGDGPATGFGFLSSQNPGSLQIAPALFIPNIRVEILEQGFRIDEQTVETIKAKFHTSPT